MSLPHRLVLPLISVLLVSLPVAWAYPEDLDFWHGVAIVSGWLGYGLLLACLLLMVREPRLAAWLGGLERMYRWHHRLAVMAYLVLLAHPLALALGTWEKSPVLAWTTLVPERQNWPVWLGWSSLLTMMAGMALTFVRHLPYAAWRGLHILLAAAVLLGLVHLLLLGLDEPLLWAPVLAIGFMLWRFFRSDRGLVARPYVVTQVDHHAANMVEVTLQPLAHPIAAKPGQFVLAAFLQGPHFQGCGEFHPFTLSDIGDDGQIALVIKALGDCTRHLQAVECGVAVRVEGPFGTFLTENTDGPALWIAGGVGITPFVAVLRHEKLSYPVRLIYLYRDANNAAYLQELQALATELPQLRLEAIPTGDTIPDLENIIPNETELSGYICQLCGPAGLVDAAIGVLRDRGIPPPLIHFERFDFR